MPEDTEQPNAPDSDAPTMPAPPTLAPGQLRLAGGPEGFVVMSVAVAHIRPDDFRAAVKDWILNFAPDLVKELVEEQIKQKQEQRNRLQLVTDPGTVQAVAKGHLKSVKKGLQA